MNTHNLLMSAIVFVLLIYFILRQVTPRRPTRFRFYFMPIVGLIEAYQNFPRPNVPVIQILECLISVAIGIGFGLLQARYTKVYESNNEWVMRGDWRYVVSWILLFAIRAAIMFLFGSVEHTKNIAVEWIIWVEIAVVWGVRSLVLHIRYPQLKEILVKKSRKLQ